MLDGRKLARMVANRGRMRRGRTRTVTLVYVRPEGTTYVAADVVWRAQQYSEPVVERPSGAAEAVRAECPLEVDPRLVSLVADTPESDAASVAAAPQYEILSYEQGGIAPNRWTLTLRRLR